MRASRSAAAALLAAALAGCAGNQPSARDTISGELKDMREAAMQRIADSQRAARARRSIDGLEVELLAFEETVANLRFQVRTLNARPDATRAEFDALLERFGAQRSAVRSRILARHFDLIAATTPEEWK